MGDLVKRHNFYVDDERILALKLVAEAEHSSISDLVREGIDRVIRERVKGPTDRAQLRSELDAFLAKHEGKAASRTVEQIEDLISLVNPRG
jgi:Arc/MetJ-type ribon-helix-helix transcriptional regulator